MNKLLIVHFATPSIKEQITKLRKTFSADRPPRGISKHLSADSKQRYIDYDLVPKYTENKLYLKKVIRENPYKDIIYMNITDQELALGLIMNIVYKSQSGVYKLRCFYPNKNIIEQLKTFIHIKRAI